jgi:hypothetical protein
MELVLLYNNHVIVLHIHSEVRMIEDDFIIGRTFGDFVCPKSV